MTLRLNGDSSGFTEIKAPNAAGDNSITLPTSNGSANELLKNGGTAGSLEFATDIVVDSSDRLLVGTSTFAGTGGGAKLQVINDDGSDTRTITVGEDGVDQKLHLGLLNSGTSYITWGGHYDNGWTSDDSANLLCLGALTLSATETGSRIQFRTTASANSSPLTHVELGSDGTLALKSTCPGIDFSGIQTNASGMTSETLDSYEEGNWSPRFLNNGGGAVTTVLTANYTKIGNLVTAICFISVHTRGTFTTENLLVGNLPFQSNSNVNIHTGVAVGYFNNFTNTFSSITGTVQPNSTDVLLRGVRSTSAQSIANLNANDIQVGSSVIFTATYHV